MTALKEICLSFSMVAEVSSQCFIYTNWQEHGVLSRMIVWLMLDLCCCFLHKALSLFRNKCFLDINGANHKWKQNIQSIAQRNSIHFQTTQRKTTNPHIWEAGNSKCLAFILWIFDSLSPSVFKTLFRTIPKPAFSLVFYLVFILLW